MGHHPLKIKTSELLNFASTSVHQLLSVLVQTENLKGELWLPLIFTWWHIMSSSEMSSHEAATSSSKALTLHFHMVCSVKCMSKLLNVNVAGCNYTVSIFCINVQHMCFLLTVCIVLNVRSCGNVLFFVVCFFFSNTSTFLLFCYHFIICIKQIRIVCKK